MESYFRDVYIVCFRLAENGVRLKWKKCKFGQEEVEYLGHVISKNAIRPSPSKIQKISDFQLPDNVKQMRGFLGLTGYFRKFIKNYSTIAAPLYDALQIKDENGHTVNVSKRQSEKKAITITEKEKEAFEKLKLCLVTTPDENPDLGILMMPDFEKPFVLYTDACHEGLGAVLCQEDETKCVLFKKADEP